MIRIKDFKNTQAKMVLEAFKLVTEDSDMNMDLQLKDFNNCREQGYVIELDNIENKYIPSEKRPYFAFAEHHNSDSIVVYTGYGYYQSTSTVTEDFWRSAILFEYGHPMEAAFYIKNELAKIYNNLTKTVEKV